MEVGPLGSEIRKEGLGEIKNNNSICRLKVEEGIGLKIMPIEMRENKNIGVANRVA